MVNIAAIGLSLLATFTLATFAFIIARVRHQRYDVIDVFWGPLIASASWTACIQSEAFTVMNIVVLVMVSVWALRLSWYIGRRWWNNPTEDPRYKMLRRSWPKQWIPLQIFFRIYLLQACLATAVALPVLMIIYTNPALGWWTYLGIIIWSGGFILEVIADQQLATFLKTQRRDVLLTTGLRRWIRHPNYLGEISLWWGIVLMNAPSQYWWLSAIGAATVTCLIVKISGIPPAELRLARKPGWITYRQQTGALLPRLPV